ncbi:MAG: hypothetical protein A2945_02010 [Candidatus Liptonbacteria bacterium RIFCSPLOWO2_01_FULL_52_25]|uniref:Uncharacterized protein n=1 Tax=Candidatus Liptonbacteria bacterium RIFCSPLOWO2_01_FULL_52_25 TaxID=1798650 RepID=A0A1G2CEW5_9BACT|nr:MAG: hypothetical protein A2945_02010 [Candidatus Liptonbacteria bacterium RIFCSPLOWO2_01_FULL_52_25]
MAHGNEKGRNPKVGKAGFQLPSWFFILCILTLVPGFSCTTHSNEKAAHTYPGVHEHALGEASEEAQRFIDINRNVTLTPEQEAVRVAALSQLPAPCCSEFTAATCCCECNLTRAIWGLSKSLIVNGADVSHKAVFAKVFNDEKPCGLLTVLWSFVFATAKSGARAARK